MGPLVASTRAHERRGHPGPCLSLGWFPVHGFSSKKGNEPLGLVERTQELYGLATENLESVTSWPMPDPANGKAGPTWTSLLTAHQAP